MMDREQYAAWWRDNTGRDGELIDLPEPTATLAAHVMALQGRIDALMDPDEHDLQHNAAARPGGCRCYLTQCACAYDYPDDVCMVHEDLCETCEHPFRRHATTSALRVLGCVVRGCECRQFTPVGVCPPGRDPR